MSSFCFDHVMNIFPGGETWPQSDHERSHITRCASISLCYDGIHYALRLHLTYVGALRIDPDRNVRPIRRQYTCLLDRKSQPLHRHFALKNSFSSADGTSDYRRQLDFQTYNPKPHAVKTPDDSCSKVTSTSYYDKIIETGQGDTPLFLSATHNPEGYRRQKNSNRRLK